MSAFGEPLRLVHHHPGRVRARADVFVDAKDDHPAVVQARAVALAAPIRNFAHSPTTGSILIEYAPGALDPDALLERIADAIGCAGVAHHGSDRNHRAELVDSVLNTVRTLNRMTYAATKRRADLREVVPGVLAITSLISFLSGGGGGGRMPRWEVAIWFAQTFYVQWHAEEIARKFSEASASSP